MNQENVSSEQSGLQTGNRWLARAESVSYYTFLVSLVLSPIVFWPSTYLAMDTIKTIVIGITVLASAIFLGLTALKEKKLVLPPRPITWVSVLSVLSLIISAFVSIHAGKSLFGQGFEVNTVSFIATMFLAALVAFTLIQRKLERAVILYVGMFASYLVVFIYQILRIVFGVKFATFGIFTSQNSTLLGNWFDLGTYSMLIALISLCAVIFLSLSQRMKIVYWALVAASTLTAIFVGNSHVWGIAFLVLLAMAIFSSIESIHSRSVGGFMAGVKNLAWIPVIACIVAGLFVWKGASVSNSVAKSFNVTYSEISLPWQMTLDIASGAIKQNPMFGVGANHFLQAYLVNKPDAVNMSDAWGVDFQYGFGFIPTLIAEQGLVGLVLWILFFVFLGICGARTIKNVGGDPTKKFVVISSFISSVALWLISIVSVPSHIILFLTFVVTGIFFGASAWVGASKVCVMEPKRKICSKIFPIVLIVAIVVALIWAIIYVKKVVALSYFGSGVKQLTTLNDPARALSLFTSAYNADHLDVYLQGKAEAGLAIATAIATEASKTTNASTSEALIKQFAEAVNAALIDSRAAIAYDPNDYYNRVSEARVSELATNLKMQNAFENAVQAYTQAINLNPKNPSIYLSLARLEVGQNKLDDAIKAIGAALQVKSNYIDAVFLLSQVYASKGDLSNAIIAANFATQLNPQNAQVFFQLGLLQYNNKDYAAAVKAFETATKLQTDYANAQYFLGLSYARTGKTADAIAQFELLAKTNADNQEVVTILKNLNAGKSIFENPQTVSSPEKRSSLPIKTKK
ncbi:MAG: tetratricopeptide repeat protein [Candidatus Taylorbacteria bacterium]